MATATVPRPPGLRRVRAVGLPAPPVPRAVPAPPRAGLRAALAVPAPPAAIQRTAIARFLIDVVRWTVLWLVLAVVVPSVLLGWRPVAVVSGSMAPLIRTGDVVLVDGDAALAPGSVVTYADPSRGLVTHRLHGWDDDGSLILRGDANRVDDAPVEPTRVMGSGRLLVPLIGLPVAWVAGGRVEVLASAVAVAVLLEAGRRVGSAPRGRGRPVRRRALRLVAAVLPLVVGLSVVVPAQAAFSARTSAAGSSLSVVQIPPATNLSSSCSGLLAATVTLTWTPSATPLISRQLVQRSTNGGAFATIADLAPTATSRSDTSFPLLGATYTYRIVTTTSTPFSSTSSTTSRSITLLGLC